MSSTDSCEINWDKEMIAPPMKPDVPILQNMETEKYLNA